MTNKVEKMNILSAIIKLKIFLIYYFMNESLLNDMISLQLVALDQ
jgi:hypothetical protein